MEAIGNVARRLVEATRHQREAVAREPGADDMPEMQSHEEEKARPMFERDGQRRGGSVDMLALWGERR